MTGNGRRPGGRTIEGRVRDGDRRPVAGATITLVDAAGRQVDRTGTGHGGEYRLAAPADGAYILITSAAAYRPNASTLIVDGGPVRLDVGLSGAGGVRGVVRSAVTGVPVRGAAVSLADATGEVVGSRISDENGGYEFIPLVAGTYTLAATARSYRPTALIVVASEGARTRQDVELAQGAAISGTVHVPGDTRPPITVTLVDSCGNAVRETIADGAGRYAFHDLDADAHTVVATAYGPATHTVRIDRGQRVRHDVGLPWGGDAGDSGAG